MIPIRLFFYMPLLFLITLLNACMDANYYLKKAQVAYQQQDYHVAFENTLVAANYGNLQAQYAVGYLYFYGLGTDQNAYLARMWMYKAANFGNRDAILALKTIDEAAPNPILMDAKKPWKPDTHEAGVVALPAPSAGPQHSPSHLSLPPPHQT